MTEKEKRDGGFLFNANYDEEILSEINRCTLIITVNKERKIL